MAEKERFELSLGFTPTTPLAGEPLRPLGYFSIWLARAFKREMAEREGFEPPVPFSITGFQDQRHQPLGHPSVRSPTASSKAPAQYSRKHSVCQSPGEKNSATRRKKLCETRFLKQLALGRFAATDRLPAHAKSGPSDPARGGQAAAWGGGSAAQAS